MQKEDLLRGAEVMVNPKGWMNDEDTKSWRGTVWKKRKNCIFNPRALLIMDSMKAHFKDLIKDICKSVGAKIFIIRGLFTKIHLPLDIGINRSFKSKLRNEWEK